MVWMRQGSVQALRARRGGALVPGGRGGGLVPGGRGGALARAGRGGGPG